MQTNKPTASPLPGSCPASPNSAEVQVEVLRHVATDRAHHCYQSLGEDMEDSVMWYEPWWLLAPLPVQVAPRKYRDPDLVFLTPDRMKSLKGQPVGADLIMEVVSEGEENRQRDYIEKRREYAAANVGEYWIVDPAERKVTVLTLSSPDYQEHGVFGPGDTASSAVLSEFTENVNELFAKCDEADAEA